ncbi:MAG: PQQ-binding-like beta-propeller repeat protein [Planctomycetota bacterium]
MKQRTFLHPRIVALLLGLSSTVLFAEEALDELRSENWHQWRGPDANGVAPTAEPPLRWSEDENVRWKVPIEGRGSSTPIVWKDKVYILTAVNTGEVDPTKPKPEDQPKRVFGIKHPNTKYQFLVLCLDRATGKELWRRRPTAVVPHEGVHHDNDYASASPTTDGKRLYCWFGSAGLFAYDLNGKKLWEKNLGQVKMGASLGEGCSPVVYKNRIAIVRDHQRQSYVQVLDATTGDSVWKVNREEGNAWATPLITTRGGKTQLITAASKFVRSYDFSNGEVIWQCGGLTGNVIPCPVLRKDVVYAMSGYQGYAVQAMSIDAKGDVSGSDKVLWKRKRGTPYIPSPVLYGDNLYFQQSNTAIMTCLDAKTGNEVIGRTRLPGLSNVYSSPVAANGHVYFTDRRGTTLVIENGKKLNVVATNRLSDRVDASPAIAGDALFLRGRKFLYCLAEKK